MSYNAQIDSLLGPTIASNQGWSDFSKYVLTRRDLPTLRGLVVRGFSRKLARLKLELNHFQNSVEDDEILSTGRGLMECVLQARYYISVGQ